VSGGVWTVNVGYGRERIANAVRDQLVKMNYFANRGLDPRRAVRREADRKMPGMSRVYYTNSGSEANEKAFKMIRQIAHKRYGGKKHKILYRDRDYHGSTIATMSPAASRAQRAIRPLRAGLRRWCRIASNTAPSGSRRNTANAAADAIEEVILREGSDTVGGLCLEPITAGGGVITPPEGYWPACRRSAASTTSCCISTRSSAAWAAPDLVRLPALRVKPDFVTMAKGVASGYAAIACMVTTEKVFEMFKDDPRPTR
jgi:taurine-pyruvate aminotransferase